MPCSKCGNDIWGSWKSSTTGKTSLYCRPCRTERAKKYSKRIVDTGEHFTNAEWLEKLGTYLACPHCDMAWADIPPRPNKRYKYTWTKDHIVPLSKGGGNVIANIQPLCYRCQFKKNASYDPDKGKV